MIRSLEPRDMARLLELHAAQNRRDGTRYPLPRMFNPQGGLDPDIALALAVERRQRLTQGIYFQTMAEMCFAGCDARSTLEVGREANAIGYTMRALGYTRVRCDIPHVRVGELEESLLAARFRRSDHEFASFFLDLEP
jgi:hypothetical protein